MYVCVWVSNDYLRNQMAPQMVWTNIPVSVFCLSVYNALPSYPASDTEQYTPFFPTAYYPIQWTNFLPVCPLSYCSAAHY